MRLHCFAAKRTKLHTIVHADADIDCCAADPSVRINEPLASHAAEFAGSAIHLPSVGSRTHCAAFDRIDFNGDVVAASLQ